MPKSEVLNHCRVKAALYSAVSVLPLIYYAPTSLIVLESQRSHASGPGTAQSLNQTSTPAMHAPSLTLTPRLQGRSSMRLSSPSTTRT